jgi:hypothetical protein
MHRGVAGRVPRRYQRATIGDLFTGGGPATEQGLGQMIIADNAMSYADCVTNF